MSRLQKIISAVLVLLIALLAYLEASQPQDLNWSPSYSAIDRIPLGARVLYENLKEQNFPVQEVNTPPFEFLNDSTISGTYFFLNDRLNFDDRELEKLIRWIEKGNTAFIIAEDFGENLLDTLSLKLEAKIPVEGLSSKPLLNFTAESLEREQPFLLNKEVYHTTFLKNDSLDQEVLGVSQLLRKEHKITDPDINFIRDSIGKGAIYLNSTPKAFSNYFLLNAENYEYSERALAYIPVDQTFYWDSYYKSGKTFNTSPLFVILNNRALKWAYYFLLAGSFLFVVFEGKRKQRSIPVIEPPCNKTLDFTRTISGLYLDRKDYKSIASKKITLFLEYVRMRYRFPAPQNDTNFYLRLAEKSGKPPKEVKKLLHLMGDLQKKPQVTKEDLLRLNRAIKTFKKKE